jgi:hypothetical protein
VRLHVRATHVDGLVVRLDRTDITKDLGQAIVVDPGPHVILAEAPGHLSVTKHVTVDQQGATRPVDIPPLARQVRVRASAQRGRLAPADQPPAPALGAAVRYDNGRPSARRRIALAVGGAGLVTTGVGLWFGLRARGLWADSGCPDLCGPNAADLVADAQRSARAADILVGVGLAGLAGGAVLWLTAPEAERTPRRVQVAPRVGNGIAGVVLGGAF